MHLLFMVQRLDDASSIKFQRASGHHLHSQVTDRNQPNLAYRYFFSLGSYNYLSSRSTQSGKEVFLMERELKQTSKQRKQLLFFTLWHCANFLFILTSPEIFPFSKQTFSNKQTVHSQGRARLQLATESEETIS